MERVLNKFVSRLMWAYYRGPNHPMKLRLYYGLRQFQNFARLTIPYLKEGWITVDEQDLIGREILVHGSYEPEVWKALANFAESEEIIWDVGAHIGTFSIRAMLDSRVKGVHAFEPDSIHSEILEMNLALNEGHATVHRFALSSQPERRKLYHGPLANGGLSSFIPQAGREIFEVACRSADELVFQEHLAPPTLVKVDVEGWEFQIFKGARRLLTEIPPKAIVFETDSDESGEMLDRTLRTYLESLGYQVKRILRSTGAIDRKENFLATSPIKNRYEVNAWSSSHLS